MLFRSACLLDAPNLRVLEVRDAALGVRLSFPSLLPPCSSLLLPISLSDADTVVPQRWAVDPDSLADPAWTALPLRTPRLHTLMWRPVWAARGAALRVAADGFAECAGQVLDLLWLGVAFDEGGREAWDVRVRRAPERPWILMRCYGVGSGWRKV